MFVCSEDYVYGVNVLFIEYLMAVYICVLHYAQIKYCQIISPVFLFDFDIQLRHYNLKIITFILSESHFNALFRLRLTIIYASLHCFCEIDESCLIGFVFRKDVKERY